MQVAFVVWGASRTLTSETFGPLRISRLFTRQSCDKHPCRASTHPTTRSICRCSIRDVAHQEELLHDHHKPHIDRSSSLTISSHEKLSAAANDRKARLAQLKSLKRKQAPTTDEPDHESSSVQVENATALTHTDDTIDNTVTKTYLSGRNFDPETRNVKLGFENLPIADPTSTLEYKAQQLALETKQQQELERVEDKGLDLFKLQPKKPNWDLKRDLELKMKPLDMQTENAIARLVRERIEGQKAIKEKEVRKVGRGNEGDGEEVGMEGTELVEAMHLKEQEEERERRRDEEDEEDGS
jgi:coiled-coil domain-containing protein 12